MYRYSNGQISLSDFNQPAGMNLKESNRWVKKAQTIPWLDIEKRYAKLFTNRKGNVAKPLRLALGACIIQAEYGFSDEETVLAKPDAVDWWTGDSGESVFSILLRQSRLRRQQAAL